MNKMRVMQVIPAVDTVGGAEMFSLELSSNFDSSKVDVLYVCLYPKPKETTLNNYYEKFGAIFIKELKSGEKLYKIEILLSYFFVCG